MKTHTMCRWGHLHSRWDDIFLINMILKKNKTFLKLSREIEPFFFFNHVSKIFFVSLGLPVDDSTMDSSKHFQPFIALLQELWQSLVEACLANASLLIPFSSSCSLLHAFFIQHMQLLPWCFAKGLQCRETGLNLQVITLTDQSMLII